VTLNAANEVAVERFLRGDLSFARIPALIEDVLERVPVAPLGRLEDVFEADRAARACAMERLVPA
jgi:1-deoxy-D-xylulose-5-phosphate reductoisomerase